MSKQLLRIGDFADVVSGGTPNRDRKEYFVGNIPWVKTLDLNIGHIYSTEEQISEDALSSIAGSLNPIGTVMVAMYGGAGTIGKSGVLGLPAATNQSIASILPDPLVFDSDFLHFQLRLLRPAWMRFSQGNRKAPNINKGIVEQMPVWLPNVEVQKRIASKLQTQLERAQIAVDGLHRQVLDANALSITMIAQSLKSPRVSKQNLSDVVFEETKGIGRDWRKFPVLGATRSGLAPARENPGKNAERYKPVSIGSVFYNPMRVLIGSIAFVDVNDEPGITSPDYVVLKGKPGVVDSRWFYYWLRSPWGEQCIQSLARGAVRERMLFNRLAEGEIELPDYDSQLNASKVLAQIRPMRDVIHIQLKELELLTEKLLAQAFGN